MRRTLCGAATVLALAACTPTAQPDAPPSTSFSATNVHTTSATPKPVETRAAGEFTFAFAGDVHFEERTATRLANDPATAFGEAAAVLSRADLTMLNLETAITTRGTKLPKPYNFRAPATAFDALRAAGVDVVSLANNHAADYSDVGLADTLAAIKDKRFPTVGIGATAAQAYAPWTTTVRGVRLAVIAASQMPDETLAHYTADADSPGIASAFEPELIASVRAAKQQGYTVVVYLHWGHEYTDCPNEHQTGLADALAAAGASAVVGTSAHQLQGHGWRPDGVYVAYGLGNYLWWRSFGDEQDDSGVLFLTFRGPNVVGASFEPARIDGRGVPVPASGATRTRIENYLRAARGCAALAAAAPR